MGTAFLAMASVGSQGGPGCSYRPSGGGCKHSLKARVSVSSQRACGGCYDVGCCTEFASISSCVQSLNCEHIFVNVYLCKHDKFVCA